MIFRYSTLNTKDIVYRQYKELIQLLSLTMVQCDNDADTLVVALADATDGSVESVQVEDVNTSCAIALTYYSHFFGTSRLLICSLKNCWL